MLRDELDSPVPDATGGSPERPGTHRNTNPDANALIVYEPEGSSLHGVVFHHRELVAGAFQTRLWVPDIQAGRERILVADPLYDTVALVGGLLTGLLSAATVVLLPDGGGAALGRTIARSRPTVLLITSGRLQALVADAAGRSDLSSLRVVMVSGPHLPSDVAAELERRTGGARVRHGYATTGSGSFVHAQPVYGKVTPGAMGVPVTGTVASVVAPDDLSVPCPSGEVGRLLVAGPQVATPYWNDKEGTAHRFVDGWMVTDELVTVDGDGVFRHVGRLPSSASPIVERAPIRRTGPTGSHWA